MINYFLIIVADIFLAFNFIAQKKYQSTEGNSMPAGLFYNLSTGLISAIIFVFLSGFDIKPTAYSFIAAFAQTILVSLYTLISFKILKDGNIALYTLFLLTGGMVLPYIFGVLFLDELLTIPRTIGLILIIIAIALSNTGIKKPSKKQIFLCILIFIINGFVSIISKLHQTEVLYETIDSESFVFWTSIIKFFACIPLFLVSAKKAAQPYKPNLKKAFLPIIFSSLFSGVSYLLQLIGAVELPATVLYPLVSGGSIILTSLIGFIVLRETLTREQIIGILVCFIGTCLFL